MLPTIDLICYTTCLSLSISQTLRASCIWFYATPHFLTCIVIDVGELFERIRQRGILYYSLLFGQTFSGLIKGPLVIHHCRAAGDVMSVSDTCPMAKYRNMILLLDDLIFIDLELLYSVYFLLAKYVDGPNWFSYHLSVSMLLNPYFMRIKSFLLKFCHKISTFFLMIIVRYSCIVPFVIKQVLESSSKQGLKSWN